jgi:cytidylate kinase
LIKVPDTFLTMIITIDGPAGAGKSTVAKALARRLGFEYLDTGAMYRAVALAGLQAGIDFKNQEALAQLLDHLSLEMPPGRILLNGADATDLIRSPEVTAVSSSVAVSQIVRRFLAKRQRALAEGRNVVCEGRDQGTVVFPDAICKFFLVADPEERARRRCREMVSRGQAGVFQEVLQAQTERDHRDAARELAPMVPAPDAIVVDTTPLDLNQVVSLLEEEVRRCLRGSPGFGTNSGVSS